MKPQHSSLGGRPGTFTRIGSQWIGWSGQVAHPNSPIGGGGPGQFAPLPGGADDGGDFPSPWSPNPASPIPLDQPTSAPKAPNAPPATTAKSLGSIKKKQSDLVDYDIQAEIVADGSGGSTGADTSFNRISSTVPSYEAMDGKITKFSGKLIFKGTIQIQTKYAADSTSTTLSCYGRGTTTDDISKGDITLGFHESCHRADYESYLSSNALPDPPEMSIGMDSKTYDAAAKKFGDAVNAYWKAMASDSKQKTDQVGFTLAKADKTGSCYVHQIP